MGTVYSVGFVNGALGYAEADNCAPLYLDIDFSVFAVPYHNINFGFSPIDIFTLKF